MHQPNPFGAPISIPWQGDRDRDASLPIPVMRNQVVDYEIRHTWCETGIQDNGPRGPQVLVPQSLLCGHLGDGEAEQLGAGGQCDSFGRVVERHRVHHDVHASHGLGDRLFILKVYIDGIGLAIGSS
ncbi:Uncharacterised protein [Mycobacteroides abscessus subsp. abscessus]|nr:Uncharacterised protein [Mycobacteroides abscessus subsp. abscessus]